MYHSTLGWRVIKKKKKTWYSCVLDVYCVCVCVYVCVCVCVYVCVCVCVCMCVYVWLRVWRSSDLVQQRDGRVLKLVVVVDF